MSATVERAARRDAPYQLSVGFLTDVGRGRERNEDAYSIYLPYAGQTPGAAVDAFFAVADGMGGHDSGDVASRFVVDRMERALVTGREDRLSGGDLGQRLDALLRDVNRDLCRIGAERGGDRNMGSTLTLAALQGGTLYLAHVGDSRCYRLRDGRLEQLTPDHSWVAEQQRAGLLTEEEGSRHPQRNLLTQCLGISRDLEVFIAREAVGKENRYLLCSDGLHGEVPHRVLARVLMEEADPQSAVRRLVDLANAAGGPDNITAVVFDVRRQPSLNATLPGRQSTTLRPRLLARLRNRLPSLGERAPAERVLVMGGAFLVLGAAGLGGWLVFGGDGDRGLETEPPTVPAEAVERQVDGEAAEPAGTHGSEGIPEAGERPHERAGEERDGASPASTSGS